VNCDEVRAAILAGERSQQIDAHRRNCMACHRAEPGLEVLRRHLDEADLWADPSPGLEDQVMARLRTAWAAGRPHPSVTVGKGAAPDAGRAAARAGASARPARPRRRWSLTSGVAVAAMGAAVAAAAAVVAIVVSGSSSNRPDWEIDLAATRNAPAASATVYGWNDAAGTRLELDVDGLPPSGPDAYYVIWMTSPDGRHVPAGTFRSSGTVWGWSGVTEDEFPRVWVTLEANDMDESLSGPAVLDTPGAK
jgi:hypothetical protein